MRWVPGVLVVAMLMACNVADTGARALPAVGPFALVDSVSIGTTAERVFEVRKGAVRAPIGGVREQLGEWMIHYDLPTPRVDSLYVTMPVREISALRGAADSGAAQQLQDSLLQAIRASDDRFAGAVTRCTRAARGRDSVTWVVIPDSSRELALGYWVSGERPPVDDTTMSDSSPRRLVPPLTLAMTLRLAGIPRAWEQEVACPSNARD